jgi:low temperature requirement protein LtrA
VEIVSRFKERFWLPPRAHGETIEDRSVSFLELFYDLVFVVVIARAAHHLAEHLTWLGLVEFGAIFGLIWLAWVNGTTYHDLHGREDGRSRTFIFIQMLIMAVLAVFTSDATGEDGAAFAITFSILMLVLSWLWYSVRRQDSEEWSELTGRYLTAMVGSTILMTISAFLPDNARLIAWWVFLVGWILGGLFIRTGTDPETTPELSAGDSLVERFGLFIIIVLGEVVVGVVTGISDADPGARAVITGLLGLVIGFGVWWSYFDFIGRRLPAGNRDIASRWMFSHLPLAMAIAAAGAAMVSLVEHATDERAPAATSWLLTGSIAIALISMVLIMLTLADYERLPELYQPVVRSVVVAAGVVAAIGFIRPAPWLLLLLVIIVLTALWTYAVNVAWRTYDDPRVIYPNAQ